jgi:putative DNA primase/helicase
MTLDDLLIDGCVAWQDHGLAQPKAVRAATTEYLEAEDTIALWLAERCVQKSTAYGLTGDLFNDWKRWTEAAGEQPGSQKLFSIALEERGFKKRLDPVTRRSGFDGIRLQTEYSDEP